MEQSKEQRDNQKREWEAEPHVLKGRVDAVEHEQAEAKKRDENYKDRQIKLNGQMVTLTFFLAVFALFGSAVSIWQGKIGKDAAVAAKSAADTAASALTDSRAAFEKTIHEMKAQTAQATIAAKGAADGATAAKIAADSTVIQVDIMRKSTRALVGPPVSFTKVVLKAGVKAEVLLTFKNTGSTPALNYQQTATFIFRDADWKFVPEYRYAEPVETSGFGVLVPTAESVFPLVSKNPLTQITIDAMNGGTRFWYVYGFVLWQDIFDTCYKTTFCMRNGKGALVFVACPNTDYNQTIEEPCRRRPKN